MNDYACRSPWPTVSGRGFDSPRLHLHFMLIQIRIDSTLNHKHQVSRQSEGSCLSVTLGRVASAYDTDLL